MALEILSDYWRAYGKPMGWLFSKHGHPQQHIVNYTVNQAVFAHKRRLGWDHNLTCHWFFGDHF